METRKILAALASVLMCQAAHATSPGYRDSMWALRVANVQDRKIAQASCGKKRAVIRDDPFKSTGTGQRTLMAMASRKAPWILVAWFSLWGCGVNAQNSPAAIPKYLALARELVENTKPEDNRYSLGGQSIGLPGDFLSNKYSVSADCSGFLIAIFDRAKYSTISRMEYLPGTTRRRTRPAAEDFVYSIEVERGFKRIRDARKIEPGDLLAHAMLDSRDQRQTGTTGHVFLIDSPPKPIEPQDPIVAGTRQLEIAVIDSNEEYVGADDTRLADPSNKIKGLGRGTIRIYVDSNGELVGWARTFKATKRFFSYDPRFPSDTKLRKAAIGRPMPGS